MSELFRNILDAVNRTFSHMSNADFGTLAVIAIAVVVLGILLLRGR
jgi:uncharacterized protein YceH (UPF0502 family)